MLTARRAPRSALALQQATSDAARLARKHLPLPTGTRPHIESRRVAGADLTVRMGTTITFPEMTREQTRALVDAIEALPGYHSMAWTANAISFLRAI